ncbi:adenylate/guanylate cyclase domain-containing protein [Pseudonocardia spinosispora]|uniref:adenylate/guanylate cyclase domain-containing protein n=1 Tax=Pseudonocardia spinosispora TaxID=103441 RepID=UPI0003FEAA55|nr:adenylate/guanylate cyclase domain-containing protein [Pseudonocardia spinosispora]
MTAAENRSGWRSALRRVRHDHSLTGRAEDSADATGPLDDDAADTAAGPTEKAERSFALQVEELLLQAPRRYTPRQLRALTGIERSRTLRLWHSLGFADVESDDVVFTDNDVQAVERLEQLRATGLISADLQVAVTRSIAQAMSGLAEWQVELFFQVLSNRPEGAPHWTTDLERLLPALSKLQEYVWRRHLAVAAGRLLANAPSESDVRTLVVGSTDLVGFTRTARRLTATQLVELVELFHGITSDVIADGGGRIVKTVGDAVLFVTDRPDEAAEIALHLLERTAEATSLPELRTGLAFGPVLTRLGDIYGEVVDNAARLCTHSRPGRILVSEELASALEGDDRFALRLRRPIVERGYPRLHPWGLRRPPAENR